MRENSRQLIKQIHDEPWNTMIYEVFKTEPLIDS